MKQMLFLLGFYILITNSHAALTVVDGGFVYDDSQDITWLQDANLVNTLCKNNDPLWQSWPEPIPNVTNNSGRTKIELCEDVETFNGGYLNWYEAESWIAHLNSNNYLGYSDWRQPAITQPDESCEKKVSTLFSGYNCRASELGHLFYISLANPNHEGTGVSLDTTLNGLAGNNCNHEERGTAPSDCFQNPGPFINAQSYSYWYHDAFAPDPQRAWALDTSTGRQDDYRKEVSIYVWPVRSGQSKSVKNRLVYAGGGLVNDELLNIIWLQDANMVNTLCEKNDPLWISWPEPNPNVAINSGRTKAEICQDAAQLKGGQLTWYEAENWIAHLNSNNYLGYSDWRQPAIVQPDESCEKSDGISYAGHNCRGSELGHLFNTSLANPNDSGTGISIDTTLNGLPGNNCFQNTTGMAPAGCFQNVGPFINAQSYIYWFHDTFVSSSLVSWFFATVTGEQNIAEKGIIAYYVWPVRNGQALSKHATITIPKISDISLNSAKISFSISPNDSDISYRLSYGDINQVASPFSTQLVELTKGTATQNISIELNGLDADTNYFCKVHSLNSYGDESVVDCANEFTTLKNYKLAVPSKVGDLVVYNAIKQASLSDNLNSYKPLGFGSFEKGQFNLNIALPEFDQPVDVYLGVYYPTISSELFLLLQGPTFQVFNKQLIPWLTNTKGNIKTNIFTSDISIADLPKGTLSMYILITPHNSFNAAYFWKTDLIIP